MGECTYYLKAQFKNKTAAKKTLPLIKKFLRETQKAYDYWQSNRDKDSETFWKTFSKNFPLTTAYTKNAKLYGKPQEHLSGHLDFGQQDDDIEGISLDGAVLGYSACDVWHHSDWSDLAEFFKSYFKACRVAVSSDEEGTGSLEDLDLYDYQAIVEAIVKQAKEDRMFIDNIKGIHQDLDAMLEL